MKHLPVLRARRVPRVLLALTVLCALVLPAAAEEARMIIPEANLRFEANEDFTEVTITGFVPDVSFAGKILEIPSEIQGVPVTALTANFRNITASKKEKREGDSYARDYYYTPKGIYIPDCVKRIGSYAFGYSSFQTIRLPKGLEVIESYTFRGCKATSITIPATVKEIGDSAFEGCSLETVTIPEGCKLISASAFYNSHIKKLVLPPNRVFFKTDGHCIFSSDQLDEIEIPDGFIALGNKDGTLASYFKGAKIDASFALQKKLKDVKVIGSASLYEEQAAKALETYTAAIDKGEYKEAERIVLELFENIFVSDYYIYSGFLDSYSYFKDAYGNSRNSKSAIFSEWEARREDAVLKMYTAAFDNGEYKEAEGIVVEFLESIFASDSYIYKDFLNSYDEKGYYKYSESIASNWNSRREDAVLKQYTAAFDNGEYEEAARIVSAFLGYSVYNLSEWTARSEATALGAYNAALDKGEYDEAARVVTDIFDSIAVFYDDDSYYKKSLLKTRDTYRDAAIVIKEHSAIYDAAMVAGNYMEAAQITQNEYKNISYDSDYEVKEIVKKLWKQRATNALLAEFDKYFAAKDYETALKLAYDCYKGRYETSGGWWGKVDQVWYADTLPRIMQQLGATGSVQEMDGKPMFSIPAPTYRYYRVDGEGAGYYFYFTIQIGDESVEIRESEDVFMKIFNEFMGAEYTVLEKRERDKWGKYSYSYFLVRGATDKDFAAAEQARREAEAKAAEEARLAAEKQAEEARRAHEAAIESAFKEGKLHTNLYYIRLSSKKGEVLFDSVPVACEEAGLQKKDVLTAASVAFADGSTVAIPVPADADNAGALSVQNAIRAIPAPATLTLTVRRGSGKKAQSLTFTIQAEWNEYELKKLGLE